jgi:5-methylcytosine-specific restriction endonuclease McrA
MPMVNSPVLVLNQNYEPLNVCNARRAFVLVDRGKAEVLEHNSGKLRSPSYCFSLPSVIRLVYLIKRPRPKMRLTRKEIFNRDHYTCQYCGKRSHDLTLDHVIPRNKGGAHAWDNLVSACKPCNHRKAGKMPSETRMRLLRQPTRPPATAYYLFYDYLERQVEWQKFIPGWETPNGYS